MASRIKSDNVWPIAKPRKRRQKVHRTTSDNHLAFVRTLPCLASGLSGRVQAHHLTINRHRMGRKMGDDSAIPIQEELHGDTQGPQALHAVGEKNFWNRRGIDPRPVALFLWENTGDHDACVDFINQTLMQSSAILLKKEKIFPEAKG